MGGVVKEGVWSVIGDMLRRMTDVERPGSLSNRLRSKRFQHFERLVARLRRPLTILDIGGTVEFWEQRGWADREDVQITLLNLLPASRTHARISSVVGDATDLSNFEDRSVDVVFSNSVIEHLFDREHQQRMANEVVRVGRDYWLQTPNRWFPMEPHFQVPLWQFLPRSLRVRILMKRQCGRRGPCGTREEAERLIDEVSLLTRGELVAFFPDAQIVPERLGGLVKSWIVHSRFAR